MKKYVFNYKKINNKYLLTNEFGYFTFLSERNFNKLINDQKLSNKTLKELENLKFIYNCSDDDFKKYSEPLLKEYKDYLDKSTVLHIFVVSKNCNYNCIYCQAGELDQKNDCLMDAKTAKCAVDIAMQAPHKYLTFEFQGGEPLTNFEIIKYIVNYSKEKNADKHKEIEYNIVTNLSLLTDEMIDFIKENDISICTSIDGNEKLQNLNRPYAKGNSYEATVNNMKKLQKEGIRVSALLTTTRYSFWEYKSIVDEYVKLGLHSISIRPLTILGKADKNWEKIGYTPEEFIEFYKNILNYIIEINKKGYFLAEYISTMLLSKMINSEDRNYMELRSPCGAAIGQLAYYYNGEIYTCDEGRMLAEMGDKKFLLGNVYDSNLEEMLNNNLTKEVCQASCLETTKCCKKCAYMPYCGTCPVVNYAHTKDMNLLDKNNYKCKIMTGTLDTLFSFLEKNDKKTINIFRNWIR